MRITALCLAAVLTLTACASSGTPPRDRALRSSRQVRVSERLPRCPVREVGFVRGQNYREVQQAAMRLQAHAVLLDRRSTSINEPNLYTGVALVYVQDDCRY